MTMRGSTVYTPSPLPPKCTLAFLVVEVYDTVFWVHMCGVMCNVL